MTLTLTLTIDACDDTRYLRMIPLLGVVHEVPGPVAPTPQYKAKRPLFGETLVAFTLTDSQQVALSVGFAGKKGNPAVVDGIPEWLVDNPNVLALAPAADGLSCVVSAVGPLGTATVSLKADADLGAGRVELVGTFDVEVTGGAATAVSIAPGAPTEVP